MYVGDKKKEEMKMEIRFKKEFGGTCFRDVYFELLRHFHLLHFDI